MGYAYIRHMSAVDAAKTCINIYIYIYIRIPWSNLMNWIIPELGKTETILLFMLMFGSITATFSDSVLPFT